MRAMLTRQHFSQRGRAFHRAGAASQPEDCVEVPWSISTSHIGGCCKCLPAKDARIAPACLSTSTGHAGCADRAHPHLPAGRHAGMAGPAAAAAGEGPAKAGLPHSSRAQCGLDGAWQRRSLCLCLPQAPRGKGTGVWAVCRRFSGIRTWGAGARCKGLMGFQAGARSDGGW